MKRKLIALMLTILMLVAIAAGCSNNQADTPNEDSPSQSSDSQGEQAVVSNVDKLKSSDERYPLFRYGVSAAPNELVPWNPYGPGKVLIYHTVFESLFDVIDDEYIPLIAKSYEEVDQTHYKVTLYDYVYDTDGNHITADDVVYCYEYFANSGYNVKYECYEGIEKVDDYTVMFTWTRPITGIGDLEHIFGNTKIYSKKAAEDHNMATDPVGSGPYKVANYVSGSSITLEAKDDYWQNDESLIHPRHFRNVQTIEINVIAEASQNVVALQTGEIDFSDSVSEQALSDFEAGGKYADKYSVQKIDTTDVTILACNASNGVTANPDFRRAVYYALDNEAIALAVGNSFPLKSMSAPSYPDANPAMDELETYNSVYDPELAKEYLEKTSYSGETLILLCKSQETIKNAATMIQALLTQVNINTEIKALDNNLYNAALTDPDAYDIIITDIGGGFMIGSQNRILNTKDYGNDMSFALVDDPELLSKFLFTNTKENWNQENTLKLFEYIVENAYYNYLYVAQKPIVYTKDVVEAYIDPTFGFTFMPQGSTFNLD